MSGSYVIRPRAWATPIITTEDPEVLEVAELIAACGVDYWTECLFVARRIVLRQRQRGVTR